MRHMGFPLLIRQFMILSCPACATRYTIDEAQLGPNGRTVRCAACKNTWHAERVSEPIELPLTTPITEKVEDLQAVKAEKLPLKYRAMVEDKKRLQALTTQGIIWGALGAAMAAVLALAFFLRVDLVKAFPRVAGAYAMVGIPTYGTSLVFGSNTGENVVKGGQFEVTVKAQIKNTSNQPAPVPPVRVGLLDKTLQQFDSVLMPANGLVVPPHATRTLVFDVADPKNMTASVDLKFDLEAMKALKTKAVAVAKAAPEPAPAPASEGDDSTSSAVAATTPVAAEVYADADSGADTDAGPAVSDRPTPALRPALSTLPEAAPAHAKPAAALRPAQHS